MSDEAREKLAEEAAEVIEAEKPAEPAPPPDTVLLVTGELEPKQQKSAWVNEFERQGTVVVAPPIAERPLEKIEELYPERPMVRLRSFTRLTFEFLKHLNPAQVTVQ